jgi:hypothetical protein
LITPPVKPMRRAGTEFIGKAQKLRLIVHRVEIGGENVRIVLDAGRCSAPSKSESINR